MNYNELIDRNRSINPHSVFIDYAGRSLSCDQLCQTIDQLSMNLHAFSFTPGAVVGLICYDHISFLQYFLACQKKSIIPIILNPKYSADETNSIIKISEIKTILTDRLECVCEKLAQFQGGLSFIDPGRPADAQNASNKLYSDTLHDGTLFMLITSGTGGKPKIVKKNQPALAYQASNLYPMIQLDGIENIYYTNVPASHSYGLEFPVFSALYNNARLYIRDFAFSADALDEIATISATHVFSVPPFISGLVNYKNESGRGYDSLKMVVSAGMKLLPGLASKFFNAFGYNICSVYGITEIGCASFKRLTHGETAPTINNDVGTPIGENEISIFGEDMQMLPKLDCERNQNLSEDSSDAIKDFIGRIRLKKKIPDGGYYKLAHKEYETKWRENNTLFETDDSGYIAPDGSLHILARSSSFINIGGTKINSGDIENALRATGLFKEILVFGQPDAVLGEKIAAAISVESDFNMDEDEIREICRQKLPPIKVPREICIFKKPFPKTSTGKVRFDEVLKLFQNNVSCNL